MKPVAWQYRSASGEWKIGSDYSRDLMERNGYETRDLYAIPEGYVVVPVEPTQKQLDASLREIAESEFSCAKDVYDAMIKAAQEEAE